MSIDKELREELRKVADSMHYPPNLHERVAESYQHYVNKRRGRSPMKKRVIASIIAAVILIPSAVFASSYLADEIFGSVKTIEQHGGSQEGYDEIEGTLQAAKSKLTEEEFVEFMGLFKQVAEFKLKVTDEKGIKHMDRLTKEEQQQFEEVGKKMFSYIEKINETEKP